MDRCVWLGEALADWTVAAGAQPDTPQNLGEPMHQRFLTTSLFVASAALLVAACSSSDTGDPAVLSDSDSETLQVATEIAALEVNQDGSDIESADATAPEPFLLRSCDLETIRARLEDDFDADDSGDLDEEELAAMNEAYDGVRRPARRHRGRQLREDHDLDDSGDLDEAERAALEADLVTRCEDRQATLVEEFDADGSGDLDEEEWAAAEAAITDRFAGRRGALREQYDADGDGELDEAECHRARGDMRDVMESRRGSRGGPGHRGRGFPGHDGAWDEPNVDEPNVDEPIEPVSPEPEAQDPADGAPEPTDAEEVGEEPEDTGPDAAQIASAI